MLLLRPNHEVPGQKSSQRGRNSHEHHRRRQPHQSLQQHHRRRQQHHRRRKRYQSFQRTRKSFRSSHLHPHQMRWVWRKLWEGPLNAPQPLGQPATSATAFLPWSDLRGAEERFEDNIKTSSTNVIPWVQRKHRQFVYQHFQPDKRVKNSSRWN